jgi:hypothetical protein
MDYQEVDIRMAVGRPYGETPIKIKCSMHPSRLGVEDDRESLAVYRKNLHCFGCGFHVTRRYASLAFLVGLWDGTGKENSVNVEQAVRKVKKDLKKYLNGADEQGDANGEAPPMDVYAPEAFHRFLLARKDSLRYLQQKRGLSLDTIKQYQLGYTGTHYTIPLYLPSGELYSLRYRSDDTMVDVSDPSYRKYEGTWRRNAPILYPGTVLAGREVLEELWIVEGEYDALINNQYGKVTITMTNGATNIAKAIQLVRDQLPALVVNRWVIAVDQDPAGEQAASSLLSVLSGQDVVRARWPSAKDLTEFYTSGFPPSAIWFEEEEEANAA